MFWEVAAQLVVDTILAVTLFALRRTARINAAAAILKRDAQCLALARRNPGQLIEARLL